MDNEENIKTGADNGAQEAPDSHQGKTFTQEEVNAIIQSRLSREKEKNAAENAAALAEREAQLHERELRLKLKESMIDNNIPKELANIIKVTDNSDIEKAVELLKNHIKSSEDKKPAFRKLGGDPPRQEKMTDPFRRAMRLE